VENTGSPPHAAAVNKCSGTTQVATEKVQEVIPRERTLTRGNMMQATRGNRNSKKQCSIFQRNDFVVQFVSNVLSPLDPSRVLLVLLNWLVLVNKLSLETNNSPVKNNPTRKKIPRKEWLLVVGCHPGKAFSVSDLS
jgi:hypothetical protein